MFKAFFTNVGVNVDGTEGTQQQAGVASTYVRTECVAECGGTDRDAAPGVQPQPLVEPLPSYLQSPQHSARWPLRARL